MAMFGSSYPGAYQQMTLPQWQQMNQPQIPSQQMMQSVQPPQMTQPTINSTIVWVKSQKEAEDYLVAPNNSMVFMDEAMTHLYMKSADQFGRPSFSSKRLTDDTQEIIVEPSETHESIDPDKYMTKDEFKAWVDDTLEKRLSELKQIRQGQRNNGKQTEKRVSNE